MATKEEIPRVLGNSNSSNNKTAKQHKQRISKTELLQQIRSNLQRLEHLEDNLSASSVHWRQQNDGNTSADALNRTTSGNSRGLLELHTLLERYQKARSMYLQRRRKQLFMEQVVTTYDGTAVQPPTMDAVNKENHGHLITSVMKKATDVKQRCEDLYDLYQAVASRRDELEWMFQDVQQDAGDNQDEDRDNHNYLPAMKKGAGEDDNDDNDDTEDDEDVTMMTIGVDVNSILSGANDGGMDSSDDMDEGAESRMAMSAPNEAKADASADECKDKDNDDDLDRTQQRLEMLQQKKRKLQKELDSICQETRKVEQRSADHRQELLQLQHQVGVYREQQQGLLESADSNNNNNNNSINMDEKEDDANALQASVAVQDLPAKIQQLQEMQLWYDSMKQVMEELSGIKIDKVTEAPDHQLALHLILLDEHTIEVILNPIHSKQASEAVVKLVSAKWTSSPVIHYRDERTTSDATPDGSDFSLAMPPLDDIVATATTFCKPLFDVRYLIVEAQNRITTYEERVQELGLLRQDVLCKFVHPDSPTANWIQIICSLNTGLIIILKYHDSNILVLEDIVGVSGWKNGVVEVLKTKITKMMKQRTTPRQVVALVQQECQHNHPQPPTPRLPLKREPTEE